MNRHPTSSGALAGTLLAALLLSLAAAGCEDPFQGVKGCNADDECGDAQFFRCNVETAECLCRSNGACANGEICNAGGYCQAKVGCHRTSDCPGGFFCDPASSTCLQTGRCASDLHCKAGELCDRQTNLCRPGCKAHGDCQLHDTCLCRTVGEDGRETQGACTCEGDRDKCQVGICASQTCGDTSFCGYGEVCRTEDEDELPLCLDDYDAVTRRYCDPCVFGPGQQGQYCGKGPNFCLIDTSNDSLFCGVDCSDGRACANGYECSDVVVVPDRWQCGSNADCGTPDARSDMECREDVDCPTGTLCGKAPGAEEGFCQGKCLGGESATIGFCSCVVDSDCAQDICDPGSRTCSVSQRPCVPNGLPCEPIRCVSFGQSRGCHIGQNCAPLEGLNCSDLRHR